AIAAPRRPAAPGLRRRGLRRRHAGLRAAHLRRRTRSRRRL
ncbi:MAG: hypothetical protein AVDCRST_MAG04-2970, partial [uncultured Acetobacteraceae bacterium]